MGQHILVTGAAGFIGGSVLAELRRTDGIEHADLFATVRSEDQVAILSKLGVNVVFLDLNDEQAVCKTVLDNEVDILINASASFMPDYVLNMIKALGHRREVTGKPVHFIHTGVTGLFAPEAGWPYGDIRDTADVYEKEKAWDISHPVRETDVLIVEASKKYGVASTNVAMPTVYGRGSGEIRKLSVSFPQFVRTSMADKVLHKFDVDGYPPAAHISDVAALYALIVKKILQGAPVPTGPHGYVFAIAHRFRWWHIMDGLATGLHSRGLISDPEPRVWPSDELAAERLRFPAQHIRAMAVATGEQIPVNAFQLGWQPRWDEERCLESIDDEVQAVLELDKGQVTIFQPLIKRA